MSDLPYSHSKSAVSESCNSINEPDFESIREIIITDKPFDLSILNGKVQSSNGEYGASVIFTGNVRVSNEEEGIVGMTLEHFPGMTETLLTEIVDKAISRWGIKRAIVAHRIGYLTAGQPIVFVGACGLHRKEAFEAAQFIMDYLKNKATFWKKEHYVTDGKPVDVWVESKQSDRDSLQRWE